MRNILLLFVLLISYFGIYVGVDVSNAASCSPGYEEDRDGYCVKESDGCPPGYTNGYLGCQGRGGGLHIEWDSGSSFTYPPEKCPEGQHFNKAGVCINNYSGWKDYYPKTWQEKIGGSDYNNARYLDGNEQNVPVISDSCPAQSVEWDSDINNTITGDPIPCNGDVQESENGKVVSVQDSQCGTKSFTCVDGKWIKGNITVQNNANTCNEGLKADTHGYCVKEDGCPVGYRSYLFGCEREDGLGAHREWGISSSISLSETCPSNQHLNKSGMCIDDYNGWKQYYPNGWEKQKKATNNQSTGTCNAGFTPDEDGYCVNSDGCPAGYNTDPMSFEDCGGHQEFSAGSSFTTDCDFSTQHINKAGVCTADYNGWKQYYPNGWEKQKKATIQKDITTCYCETKEDSLGDDFKCYAYVTVGGSISAPDDAVCKGDANYSKSSFDSFKKYKEKLKTCNCSEGYVTPSFVCRDDFGTNLGQATCEQENNNQTENTDNTCSAGLRPDRDGYCVKEDGCPVGYNSYLFGCEKEDGFGSHKEWGISSSIVIQESCPEGEHFNKAGMCIEDYPGWQKYYPNKFGRDADTQKSVFNSCYCKDGEADLTSKGTCVKQGSYVEKAPICEGDTGYNPSKQQIYADNLAERSIIRQYDYNFVSFDGVTDLDTIEENENIKRQDIRKRYDGIINDFTTLNQTVKLGDDTYVRTIYPELLKGVNSLEEARAIIEKRIKEDGYTYSDDGTDIKSSGNLALRVYDETALDNGENHITEVAQTNKYTGKSCERYIAGYKPKWTRCEIVSPWMTANTSSSKAICKQIGKQTEVYRNCGEWEEKEVCETIEDEDGNEVEKCETENICHKDNCPEAAEKPDDIEEKVFAHVSYNDVTSCNKEMFADMEQSCTLTFHLWGGRTGLKSDQIVGLGASNYSYTGANLLQANSDYLSNGKSGIIFVENETGGTSFDSAFSTTVTIKSMVPFTDSASVLFDISGPKGNQSVAAGGVGLSFKKPLDTQGTLFMNDGEKPQLGKLQPYNLTVNLVEGASDEHMSNFKIEIQPENIYVSEGFEILKTEIDNTSQSFTPGSPITNLFSIVIDAKNEDEEILDGELYVYIQDVKVTYKIGGETVSYNINGGTGTRIDKVKLKNLGLQVDGGMIAGGRSDLTGQDGYRAEVQLPILREDIRQAATKLTRNLSEGVVSNGIYFNEGSNETNEIFLYSDMVEAGLTDGDTIIIKNASLAIDKNIDKNIGIIVLSDDNYTFSLGNKKGNIYINNKVETINALIYADGSLISANENGALYEDSELEKYSLLINGSVFTKNTVGGAVAGADGHYILPDGKTTEGLYVDTITDEQDRKYEEFMTAAKYDLNYLRKVNLSGQATDSNVYSVKISPNPELRTNPPKGFTN